MITIDDLVRMSKPKPQIDGNRQKIVFLTTALDAPYHVIIDSPFVSSMENFFRPKGKRSAKHELLALEKEKQWHEPFLKLLREYDCSIPREVIEEYYRGTVALRRSSKAMTRVKRGEGKLSNGRERSLIGKNRTMELADLRRSLREVTLLRKGFMKELEKYATENMIAKEVLDYIEPIRKACADVLDRIEVEKIHEGGLPQHKYNDSRILASAVALQRPVVIATKDYDFVALTKKFWKERCELANYWGFPVPEHPIDIAYRGKYRDLLYRPWGERVKLE